MQTIALTQGLFATVDDHNFEWLSHFKWHAVKATNSRTFYAARGYWDGTKMVRVFMHREILGLKKGEVGDHKNGDGLLNLENNLRRCSHRQNMMSMRKCLKPTASRFKGVRLHRDRAKCWASVIKIHGRAHTLGYFADEEDAALAYNAAAQILFGPFASLNPV